MSDMDEFQVQRGVNMAPEAGLDPANCREARAGGYAPTCGALDSDHTPTTDEFCPACEGFMPADHLAVGLRVRHANHTACPIAAPTPGRPSRSGG